MLRTAPISNTTMTKISANLQNVVAIIICWAASVLAAPLIQAQSPKAPLTVALERRYASELFWYQYKAAAVTTNSDVLIAVTARSSPYAQTSTSSHLWLWRIDRNGEKTAQTEIKNPFTTGENHGSNVEIGIQSLVALDSGEALLIVEFDPARPSFVKIDKNGNQVITKRLVGPSRQLSLSKMIPAPEGQYLLLGHESLDALALRIDSMGNILWEKKDDRGRIDLFVDGIPTADGGFLLVGNSGTYDANGAGPSIVWVGKYDGSGELRKEIVLKGRYGSVTRADASGYAMVYDKSSASSQDVWVQNLDLDLKLRWESQVLAVDSGSSTFKIAAVQDSRLIVSGAKYGRPYVVNMDAAGNILQTFYGEKMTISVTYDLVPSKNGFLIFSSIYSYDDKIRIHREVRLDRFSVSQ